MENFDMTAAEAMALSEASLAKIWDNPEDEIYDSLAPDAPSGLLAPDNSERKS